MVKDFLSQKGISYEERDVSRNRSYAQELVNNTGQMGVPVTVFDGQVVVGFDRSKLEETCRQPFGGSITASRSGCSSVAVSHFPQCKDNGLREARASLMMEAPRESCGVRS